MMNLRIADLCKERMIKNPYTLFVENDISEVKARQYLNGKTNRIMLDDIEILCRLLYCTPNDLMEWTPKNSAQDYEGNPLQAIRKKPLFNMADVMKNMTVGELRAMVELKNKQEEEDGKK